jgi:hypothetical protein
MGQSRGHLMGCTWSLTLTSQTPQMSHVERSTLSFGWFPLSRISAALARAGIPMGGSHWSQGYTAFDRFHQATQVGTKGSSR